VGSKKTSEKEYLLNGTYILSSVYTPKIITVIIAVMFPSTVRKQIYVTSKKLVCAFLV